MNSGEPVESGSISLRSAPKTDPQNTTMGSLEKGCDTRETLVHLKLTPKIQEW